jgi:hypothetical protein
MNTMKTQKELEALVLVIDSAPSCLLHGHECLEVCIECESAVQCSKCEPRPCQCWNDE